VVSDRFAVNLVKPPFWLKLFSYSAAKGVPSPETSSVVLVKGSDLRYLVQSDFLGIPDEIGPVEGYELEILYLEHLTVFLAQSVGPTNPATPAYVCLGFWYRHLYSPRSTAGCLKKEARLPK